MSRLKLKYLSTFASSALVLITITLFTGCGSDSSIAVINTRQAAFRAGLVGSGFIVNDGYARTIDAIEKFDKHVIDSCGGNNVGQPYKLLQIPVFPKVTEDPAEKDFGIFRLRPDEAIVYVGPTPPKADYFSFTPFMNVRRVNPKVPKGDWIFASVGDPLNSALIKTEGNGDPFHKQTVVIFAADRGVYERVAAQARAAGYPDSMINQYVIPSELLNLGVSPASDTLLILLRTANWANPAAGNAYLNNNRYATVWRVTPDPAPVPDPFPTPPLRNRKWVRETTLVPDLQAGLDRLKAAILTQTSNIQSNAFDSIKWVSDSRAVLEAEGAGPSNPLYHKYVAGDASDSPYLRSSMNGQAANFILGTDDMVVVYGVNHAATGMATYSSFGVYGEWGTSSCQDNPMQYVIGCGNLIWNGVAGMTNHDFTGSAEKYIPGDPVAPYLYAVKVLRQPPVDKSDKYWVVVPQPCDPNKDHNCNPDSAQYIPLDKPMMIGYRAYVNPVTHAGPDYSDIDHDRAIWFKLKK